MQFKTISVAMALVAGVLLTVAGLRSQPTTAVGPVWDYATVTQRGNFSENGRSASNADICYATTKGCRLEQVRVDVKDFTREEEAGMMAASAKLGEKGWELTSATDTEASNRTGWTIYFKRLRGAITRNEDQR